ncbi:hypothetical protein DPM19_02965 [Actinomadura craniellae]|uniref:HTH luxR-type domain-containing protein n=1 Tax=Actinomadura craniellae TaxID=2231787 RepID=A0A365HGE3_9ACTN|nr:LuxR family transcriptional regulator [Actinomadura craniellae]RAY17133.1 hypothetical protein DPM19_02965 [Actinomadura craniellae]
MTWRPAPLVGRERELSTIQAVLDAVRGGKPHVLGVRGEAGIGKSRLLAELGERAASHGMPVLTGRASELERDLSFALLVDALDAPAAASAAGLAAMDRGQLGELAAILPSFGPVVGCAPAASGERHRAARAVRSLLECLAGERPIALLLDDVHWADPASAGVLALLLHRPPPAPVLLVISTRTGRAADLEEALVQGVRSGVTDLLDLGPLPPEAAAELLPGVGRGARERFYEASGGNPFYLEELARAGAVTALPDAVTITGLAVPAAVRAALASELRDLPAGARRVLEGAAVAGDPFEFDLAAAVAEVDDRAALDALDGLLAAELVVPTAYPRQFRFRHPLVRRAVYEQARGGWRLGAHSRAADVLAKRGATPAERAHHVERAAQRGDLAAIDLLVQAAHEVATAAPASAAGWLEATLRLLPAGGEHQPRHLELLTAQGYALVAAGRPLDARDVLRRALNMLPAQATTGRVGLVVVLSEIEALWTSDPDPAHRLLQGERTALTEPTPDLVAELALATAYERTHRGAHVRARQFAEQALAAAREAGDPALEADAAVRLADAANCALRSDDPVELAAASARIEEATSLVAALPDDALAPRLRMLFWLATARFMVGDYGISAELCERGLDLARRPGQGLLAPSFRIGRGFVDEEFGRLSDAREAAEEALETLIVTGNRAVGFWGALLGGWVALARGDIDEALSNGETARGLLGPRPSSSAGWTIADARLAAGDPRGALQSLEEYGWVNPGLWTRDRLRALDVTVRVLLALDRVEEAAAWVDRAPAEIGGRVTGAFLPVLARARASLLLATGRAAEAERVAQEGAESADGAGTPLWAGHCRTLAGQALLAQGRKGPARQVLRRAAADLAALGATGYRDAALRVLRSLGDRPRVPAAGTGDPPDSRLASLTPREREVALLVGQGLQNGQIAGRLHLSEKTVEKHVGSLLAKLGLTSRIGVIHLLARTDGSPERSR